jgi:predicted dehydrogenase
MPEIEVVAVADPNPEARERTAREYGIAGCYEDTDSLFEHPGLEAVGVMVPSRVHADVSVAALRAGKHVLVEKPLAETLEDGERIVKAAAAGTAQAMMGFHICFHRLVQDGLRMVREGGVGKVESIRTLWCSPSWNPLQYGNVSAEKARHRHHEGALVDLATPCFELWRRFTGEEVEALWAQSVDAERPEVVATVSARLANGVLATGVFSTTTSHEIEIEVCGSLGRLRIGAERFDGLDFLPINATPGSPKHRLASLRRLIAGLPAFLKTRRRGGIYLDSFERQWRHFAAVVRGTEALQCTVEDGYRALRITTAARESGRSGQPVQTGFPPQPAHSGNISPGNEV